MNDVMEMIKHLSLPLCMLACYYYFLRHPVFCFGFLRHMNMEITFQIGSTKEALKSNASFAK